MEHKINEKRIIENITVTLSANEVERIVKLLGPMTQGYDLYVGFKNILTEVKGA